MNVITDKITITGVVQGVGFRPFVVRFAKKHKINGYVINKGSFVEIVIQGEENNVERFTTQLKENIPPLARINSIEISELVIEEEGMFESFTIKESSRDSALTTSYIPPDIAICDNCLKDMNLGDRKERYNYPFTSCVDCGPRFTVIKSLPYDRDSTTMDEFPLCDKCLVEYTNPVDRRFHAQTTCCETCGPKYTLHDKNGEKLPYQGEELINFVTRKITEGQIIAVKGIGGTHIVCSATKDEPIKRIRETKGDRQRKPFALMSHSLESIKEFAIVPEGVDKLLSSIYRPIVLLPKRNDFSLSEDIAPSLHNVGVMLPYAGIHYLLLNQSDCQTLVMTSANRSHEPIQIDNKEIVSDLSGLVDYFLLHDRVIYQRADDSVIKPLIFTSQVIGKEINSFIRKSRGFVPDPINIPEWNNESAILGVSSELHTTVSVALNKKLFLSQYIGNLKFEKTLKFMKHSINNLSTILQNPEINKIVADLHPTYISTDYGKERSNIENIPFIQVQHHFAHASALLGEHELFTETSVIFVGDGLGYGADGKIWGGEFLLGTIGNMKRINHWDYVHQPGGDLATNYPQRMVISYLINAGMKDKEIEINNDIFQLSEEELIIIIQQCRKNINTPLTSSTGRFLDAVSILLGITTDSSYEGEPAIVLESFTISTNSNLSVKNNILLDRYFSQTSSNTQIFKLFQIIFEEIKNGIAKSKLALLTHHALGILIAKESLLIAEKDKNVKYIGFSGGVGYNDIITSVFCESIMKNGYSPLIHEKLPPGDGCISAGQCFHEVYNKKEVD